MITHTNNLTFSKFDPIHLATHYGNTKTIQVLLESGANKNKRATENYTPLHLAVQEGHFEAIKLLLIAGADKDARTHENCFPLHLAIIGGYTESVKLLLEFGADKNARTHGNYSPLHLAAQEGYIEAVKLLLEFRADKDAKDDYDWTPLHTAVRDGHIEAIKILLEYNADKNARTNINRTPLHLATREGHANAVQLLLEFGVNRDAKDNKGCTPLHLASREGHTEVISILVESGANIKALNDLNQTPLDFIENPTAKDYFFGLSKRASFKTLSKKPLLFKTSELNISSLPKNLKIVTEEENIYECNKAYIYLQSKYLRSLASFELYQGIDAADSIQLKNINDKIMLLIKKFLIEKKISKYLSTWETEELIELYKFLKQYSFEHLLLDTKKALLAKIQEKDTKIESEYFSLLKKYSHKINPITFTKDFTEYSCLNTLYKITIDTSSSSQIYDSNSFYRLFDTQANKPKTIGCDAVITIENQKDHEENISIPIHQIITNNAEISIEAFNQNLSHFIQEKNRVATSIPFYQEKFLREFLHFLYTGKLNISLTKEELFDIVLFAKILKIKDSMMQALNSFYLQKILDDLIENKPAQLPKNDPLIVDEVNLNKRPEITNEQLGLILQVLSPQKKYMPSFNITKCEKLNNLEQITQHFYKN